MTGKLSVGGILGYACGNFVKQVSDEIILYGGLGGLLIGGLHYMRWITINWRQIDADLLQVVEKVKESRDSEEGFFGRMKARIIRVAPLLGGFSGGFYFGFTMG